MLNLYNMVVSIIGQVPLELEWIYSIGTLFMLLIVLCAFIIPFYLAVLLCRG